MRALRPLVFGGALLAGLAAATAQDAPTPPAGPSAGFSSRSAHHVYLVGTLLLTEPWIEADPAVPGQALAYFTIENRGRAPDKLVTATSAVADRIEIDTNGEAPGLGAGGLVIGPRQTVALKRDGVRFVFEGLKHDLGGTPTVPVVLTFERAGPVPMDFSTSDQAADEMSDPPPVAKSLVK